MGLRTNRAVIALRSWGRALGVNALLGRLLAGRGYEDRFQDAMLSAVGPDDCVWDVGANQGLYTREFAQRVGAGGRVYAFEPSPDNLERLRAAVSGLTNVTVLPCALGERAGEVAFQQGADDLGATSRIVADAASHSAADAASSRTTVVKVETGDALLAGGAVERPTLVKIDTEGFELDVLNGMHGCLEDPALRVLCIEVHFALLEERGMPDAPKRIERLLADAGFTCRWPDASHIVATRG